MMPKHKFYCYHNGLIIQYDVTKCPGFTGYDLYVRKILCDIKFLCPVNFLFVKSADLKDKQFYNALSQSFFKNHQPLISIGYYDLSDIDTYLPNMFLDSSIWNYYIAVNDESEKTFRKKLEAVSDLIGKNYHHRLYDMIVAREFIDFNYRLLGSSYLAIKGGHANHVSPFLFHSEYFMKKKAKEFLRDELNKLIPEVLIDDKHSQKSESQETNNGVEGQENNNGKDKSDKLLSIEWRILLLDDYGKKALRMLHSNEDTTGCADTKDGQDEDSIVKYSKRWILNAVLKTIKKKYKVNFKFETEVVVRIDEAINKIGKKHYDIILLDYLLGKVEIDKREYGDEFLLELKELLDNKKDDKANISKNRLMGKYWIFPISSFNSALMSKLQEGGIEKIREFWYIPDGSDLINTPGLFLYHFVNLLLLQLKHAIVTKHDIIDFILNNLTMDYKKHDETIKEPKFTQDFRLNAKRLYGIFMHRFGIKEALKQDAKNGSLFAQSVIDYYENDDEAFEAQRFYEYTRKLIFLIGYGTHEATPQMYNLFNYIVSAIPKFDDETKNDKVNNFLKAVREYIDRLSY